MVPVAQFILPENVIERTGLQHGTHLFKRSIE